MNRTTNRHKIKQVAVAAVALLTATGLAQVVSSLSASAATPETVAIGVVRDGDQRVLQIGGDGVSNSSPIVMAPYRQDSPTAVAGQRWLFERRPAGTGIPAFAYRIRNPGTGRCIDSSGATPVNGAPIILYTCSAGLNQVWWMSTSTSPEGVRFRNLRDNRCIDIPNRSTANNVALRVLDCGTAPTDWHQMFKTKTGSFDCTRRSREWQATTGLCIRTNPPVEGITATWHNDPTAIAYRDPNVFVLSNEVQSYVNATVVDAQGVQSGAVEFGSRAVRSGSLTGSVAYNAYWTEFSDSGEEYHAVTATGPTNEPNGSAVADGQGHTYVMLGTGNNGEWDLFYDYNYIATTIRQVGGRTNAVNAEVRIRNLDAVTRAQPFEFRTQLLDPNGFWVRPKQGQTAVGNNKGCDSFPTWEDFGSGAGGNRPPRCVMANRTYTATGVNPDIATFTVEKPAAAAASSPSVSRSPHLSAFPNTVNGVDQSQLARCMATNPDLCLQQVPGLSQCVHAHLVCNRTTEASRAKAPSAQRRAPVLTLGGAATAVGQHVALADRDAGKAKATIMPDLRQSTTVGALRRTMPSASLPADVSEATRVHIVAGDDQVRSWNPDSTATYHGWAAVYSADTGSLLYARLGDER